MLRSVFLSVALLAALALATAPATEARQGAAHGDLVGGDGALRSVPVARRAALARMQADGSSGDPRYPTEAGPRGHLRIAILPVSTAADRDRLPDPERVRDLVLGPGRSVAEYVRAQSEGTTTLTGDLLGPYEIADYGERCDTDAIARQALATAHAHGVDLSAYNHVMFVFPRLDCGFNGLGDLGGELTWINGMPPDFRLLAHEVGHNLGLYHAHALHCEQDGRPAALVSDTTACGHEEYGDPLSVMGRAGSALFTGIERVQLGWMPYADTALAPSDADSVFTLGSVNAPTGTLRLLQVRRQVPAHRWWGARFLTVELRTPLAPFDAFAPEDPAVGGLTVRETSDEHMGALPNDLVDVTPGSPGGHGDAQVRVGEPFLDGPSQTVIALESLAGGVARVAVHHVPSAPAGLTAQLDGEDSAALSWQASADDHGVERYEVERDGAVALDTRGLTARVTGLPRGGTVTLRVLAVDGDGNRTASAPVTVTAPPPPAAQAPAPPPARPVPPASARRSSARRPGLRVVPAVGRHGRRLAVTRRLVVVARGAALVRASLDGRRIAAARRGRLVLRLPARAAHGEHRLVVRATGRTGGERTLRLRIVHGVVRRDGAGEPG